MVSNCFIAGNRAGTLGGGVHAGILKHCSLVGNQADNGGATFSAIAENCVLYSNVANWGGGTYHGYIRNSMIRALHD